MLNNPRLRNRTSQGGETDYDNNSFQSISYNCNSYIPLLANIKRLKKGEQGDEAQDYRNH